MSYALTFLNSQRRSSSVIGAPLSKG